MGILGCHSLDYMIHKTSLYPTTVKDYPFRSEEISNCVEDVLAGK